MSAFACSSRLVGHIRVISFGRQVPGQAEGPAGSFAPVPFPQPATPQLEERHTPETFAMAVDRDPTADWRKHNQKEARQARKQVRSCSLGCFWVVASKHGSGCHATAQRQSEGPSE
jgi:hypothetical protein